MDSLEANTQINSAEMSGIAIVSDIQSHALTENDAESVQGKFLSSLRGTAREKWISFWGRLYTLADSANTEYLAGVHNAPDSKTRHEIRKTTALAIGGQVYERARLPETIGVSIATNAYKESIEQGHPSLISTALGSLCLGLFVYGQQKAIGKNWIKTTKYYPKSYDTAKELYPKSVGAIDEALPTNDQPVRQGLAMVSLGSTPFIASARANNPNIDEYELMETERLVTRRGSVASGIMGAMVLGSLSLAPHMPEKINILGTNPVYSSSIELPEWLPEKMVQYSDKAVDVLSNPWYVGGGFLTLGFLQSALDV